MKIIAKKHQLEATKEALEVLQKENRTNIVMPCGTGKTMIGSMVSESIKAKSVVLLFPSIALIRQTLAFWKSSGNLEGRSCLCVCSDKTVADDDIEVTEDELGMHITTSSNEVAQFFSNSKQSVTIFSTYQSVAMLAAGMPTKYSFDLGVFDESHRTASGTESTFTFALSDENIRITKRLFMTATPKHYLDADGESMAYSMDNEAIYGKRAYVLPVREAIKEGLISDYKVLVSAVTSKDIAVELANSKNNKKVSNDIKMMATAIAIRKAIDATGVKKVITFHNTVSAAKKFAESKAVQNTIKTKLLHVSGKMKSKTRSELMKTFATAPESLVTNARCLTEGVDSPGVDMVAFVDAKESTTDIVQAVGRAMRITPDKNIGYVLLPVFIDLDKYDNDIESALKASGMSMIWDVLTNLSEQESMIAYKRSSKTELREARKQRIDFQVVSSDPKISEKMHESIDVYYAYRNASIFDDNFNKLVEFNTQHGHCNPSLDESEELNVWLRRVRFSYKKNKLSKYNIERLEAIGFAWDGRDPAWEENFQAFLRGEETIKWRSVQRAFYRQGKMKPDREKRLRDAGFKFDADSTYRRKEEIANITEAKTNSSEPQDSENLDDKLLDYLTDVNSKDPSLSHQIIYEVFNNLFQPESFITEQQEEAWVKFLEEKDYFQSIIPAMVEQTGKIPLEFIQGKQGSLFLKALHYFNLASMQHKVSSHLNTTTFNICCQLDSKIHQKAFNLITGIDISENMNQLSEYLDNVLTKAKIYEQIKAIPLANDHDKKVRNIDLNQSPQVRFVGQLLFAQASLDYFHPHDPLALMAFKKVKDLKYSNLEISSGNYISNYSLC